MDVLKFRDRNCDQCDVEDEEIHRLTTLRFWSIQAGDFGDKTSFIGGTNVICDAPESSTLMWKAFYWFLASAVVHVA